MLEPDFCSPIHPSWFEPFLWPGYFLLRFSDSIFETYMPLAGVRVQAIRVGVVGYIKSNPITNKGINLTAGNSRIKVLIGHVLKF